MAPEYIKIDYPTKIKYLRLEQRLLERQRLLLLKEQERLINENDKLKRHVKVLAEDNDRLRSLNDELVSENFGDLHQWPV